LRFAIIILIILEKNFESTLQVDGRIIANLNYADTIYNLENKFGLSGSVHSRDLQRAYEVASHVDTGMIHINDQGVNDEPHVPFGGVKSSGMGRYNSDTVMDEFTELKWISFQMQPRDYPF
jgi:acyl-CoA reductase-like NAD-dependent aldehyde dehydrogenase